MSKVITNGNTKFPVERIEKSGAIQISRIAPYDMTNYHWARLEPGCTLWEFFRNGRLVETLVPKRSLRGDALYERIAEELKELDTSAGLGPRIDHT